VASDPKPWVAGRHAAYALRLEEELGYAPINRCWSARRRGCRIALHDFGTGNGDGIYLWTQRTGSALIVVNASNLPSRQRFTVAHELGHHEMHRFDGGDLEIPDRDIFESRDPIEAEANAFAAYLLLPDEALRRDLADVNQKDLQPLNVVHLMARYGTSYAATLNRLENANLISHATRERLDAEGAGNVERLMREIDYDEAAAHPVGDNEVAFINRHAAELYRDFVLSPAALADALGVEDADEAVRIAAAKGYARPDEPTYDEDAVSDLLS